MSSAEGITVRELTPARWPDLEKLFGSNGACGGCWCQWWRIAGVEHWDDVKGDVAHVRFRRQVCEGQAHGTLAYDGSEVVGWCSFEPRSAFPRLQRSRSFRGIPAEGAWFVGCFFVRRDQRHCGVASLLLAEAVDVMRHAGANVIEACPKSTDGHHQPDAFVYTGTRAMFERNGFRLAEAYGTGMTVMRRQLGDR